MFKKSIFYILGMIILSSSYSVVAVSSVETTIQFKNEDSPGSLPIVLAQAPYLDNFSWADLRPEYQATWNWSTTPPLTKSFKTTDPIVLTAGESISAHVSYYWWDNWYGMSQYVFNYKNRSKEYGCFVTEIRLSNRSFDYHIAIASYRYDPHYADDYLTCYVEPNSNPPFVVHMTSSKNQKNKSVDDSKNYSEAGDIDVLKTLDYYGIDLPIKLWEDNENKQAFILANNKTIPTVTSLPLVPSPKPSLDNVTKIELVNNTTEVLVAGKPLLDKFSQINSKYSIVQPQQLQPATSIKQQGSIELAADTNDAYAFVRLNYHIAGYAEDSGCYITTFLRNTKPSHIFTVYSLDPQHTSTGKNLYCFISRGDNDDNHRITVSFYDNPCAIKELVVPGLTKNPFVSYSLTTFYDTVGDEVRVVPSYDQGKKLTVDKSFFSNFNYGFSFPIDPTHSFTNLKP